MSKTRASAEDYITFFVWWMSQLTNPWRNAEWQRWNFKYSFIIFCYHNDKISWFCGRPIPNQLRLNLPVIARFMGPTWGPPGADRTQVAPLLAPWTLLSGSSSHVPPCISIYTERFRMNCDSNKPLKHTTESWWRHQIEIFSALLALCEGNPPVTGGFPSQNPVTRSLDVCFDLCLNKWLSKQSRRRWFETLSRSLSRYCNYCSFPWRRWYIVIWLRCLRWPLFYGRLCHLMSFEIDAISL